MLRLVRYNSGHAESETKLDPDKSYTIGRRTDAQIRLSDVQVSRRHCRLAFISGRWQVCDLGSSNGTFVNNCRVNQADLRPGDVLLVGATAFRMAEAHDPAHETDDSMPHTGTPPPAAQPEHNTISCTRCGKSLPADAVSAGKAVSVGGKTFCFACSLTIDKDGAAGEAGDLFGLLKDFGKPSSSKPKTTDELGTDSD